MDYTLVHYDSERWERRAYEHMKRAFVARGWPVPELSFDPELASRGLIIDVELGNLVKANRFGYVRNACHGTRMLGFEGWRDAYGTAPVDLAESALGVPEHAVLAVRGLPVRAARRPARRRASRSRA